MHRAKFVSRNLFLLPGSHLDFMTSESSLARELEMLCLLQKLTEVLQLQGNPLGLWAWFFSRTSASP